MESRAHTIAGAFDLFNGSLKKTLGGLGNIVAQSGLVQAGLAAMTGVLNAVASVLPKTVPPVEGLTNSLTALSPAAKEAAERVAELSHAQIGEGVQQQAEGVMK